ncbi:formiminoglutamate deiminase [Pseudonocardia sediminis]|uniref:Formiminoglutamate deiminase n=1 Tax=Pseudonocardia sediminis TaxID=1397368 RepID=A0A4Q7UY97_PSEST|nr:formimidoylglutamate deiminase [Pseudonocardia sediminis]RZT87067.1 formiminoglutamate deiminase [Pseudonocardia sediminis]
MTTLWCEHAWLPDGPADAVAIEVADGRITSLRPGAPRTGTVLPGVTLPGFANAHSHAFHRALRGHPSPDARSFWSWRDDMYRVAEALDPDSYRRLATAVYTEMALAGYTSVTEFHYLHHGPGGRPYDDPNAMGHALVDAAAAAGIRLTLLDTCYLAGGIDEPLSAVQRRFADAHSDAWIERVEPLLKLDDGDRVRLGAAVHSVRAVPEPEMSGVVEWAAGWPLHVHLSEQPAENEACLAAYGRTPTALLDYAGVLGPDTVAVHATHLTTDDIDRLAASGTRVCLCPTTERDLGDGIGPASQLHDAGVGLLLGSDSQAVVDPFEEARGMEMHERLAHRVRQRFSPAQLLDAAADGASLTAGAPADLVTVALDSVRTAGIAPVGVLHAAGAADVTDVMVGGRWVVRGRVHQGVDRPAAALAAEITALREA